MNERRDWVLKKLRLCFMFGIRMKYDGPRGFTTGFFSGEVLLLVM